MNAVKTILVFIIFCVSRRDKMKIYPSDLKDRM